jgi:hypothetical protein
MGDILRAAVSSFILLTAALACGAPQPPPPGNLNSSPGTPAELVEQADEDRRLTYIESRISFGYRFDEFYHPSYGHTAGVRWVQSFGPERRFAASVELPFIRETLPDYRGLGDARMELRGILSKTQNAEHVLAVGVTVPTGNQSLVEHGHSVDGQTVASIAWGGEFRAATQTLIYGSVQYNKGLTVRTEGPKRNFIQPDVIVTQGLSPRFAVYAEYSSYYEFSIHEYVPVAKLGLEIAVDRDARWTLSPRVLIPLNHAARIEETKIAAGLAVTYRY